MSGKRVTLVSIISLCAAALIGSCTKPYHEENERYVLVATNIGLPYWQSAEAGFLEAAKRLGVKAEMVGPQGRRARPSRNMFVGRETRNFPSGDRQGDCTRHSSNLRRCGCAGFETGSVH